MKSNIILEELQDWDCPILAGAIKEMPFAVPPSYFNSLPLAIPYWTEKEEAQLSFKQIAPAPFHIPPDYFDENLRNLSALSASADETKSISDALPDDYFASFPSQLLARIREEESASVSAPTRKIIFRPAYSSKRKIQVAAAAVVFLLSGFLGLKYWSQPPATPQAQMVMKAAASGSNSDGLTEAAATENLDQIQNQLSSTYFNQQLPLDPVIMLADEQQLTKDDILDYMTGEDLSL